jgi:hypothetical protein
MKLTVDGSGGELFIFGQNGVGAEVVEGGDVGADVFVASARRTR